MENEEKNIQKQSKKSLKDRSFYIEEKVEKKVDQKLDDELEETIAQIVDTSEFSTLIEKKVNACINSILRKTFAVDNGYGEWNKPKGEKAQEVYEQLNQTVISTGNLSNKTNEIVNNNNEVDKKINVLIKHYLNSSSFEEKANKMLSPIVNKSLNNILGKPVTQKVIEEKVEEKLMKLLNKATLNIK